MSQARNEATANEDVGRGGVSRHPAPQLSSQQLLWYCPSRWLLAHYDLQSNINTMSSHICLADLNNDGENLLALVDFKPRNHLSSSTENGFHPIRSPYECRMRVYRGQQLIYNHFLEDLPSCLIVTSISLPAVSQTKIRHGNSFVTKIDSVSGTQQSLTSTMQQQPLLTMTINDDVYFYHKLRPSHKLSLEDEECVINSLNKSEVDAWQMVRQNKVDTQTMRELLFSLSQELGNQELTSHSLNFIALNSNEAQKQYLIEWKLKRFQQGSNLGEQIMSMDTICCAAARLKYNSNITQSGDFGQTRDKGRLLNDARWNRIIDIQKEGLLLGTEDRHLLIYESRAIRTRLECHYRLKATPDYLLVERRSPSSFDAKQDLRTLTYKILISCRDCRIYSIDQLYLVDKKSSPCELKELVALKSNVLQMSWTGLDDDDGGGGATTSASTKPPCFVVACIDKRVYCFSSQSGQCKWVVELELPITSVVSLPKLQIGSDEASLIGVASQANRIDFYVGSNGRIVDSIYFSQDDYPQAMTFGRFGREDNCLCLVTNLGRLAVLILKRTAKFAHGQCLSSAASYASHTLASCRQIMRESLGSDGSSSQLAASQDDQQHRETTELNKSHQTSEHTHQLKLKETVNLPSGLALRKSNSTNVTDKMIDSMLHPNHNCDQASLRGALDIDSSRPRLQIPVKGRDFVNQIMKQSRESRLTSQTLAEHMLKLRDKIRSTFQQQLNFRSMSGANQEEDNRLVLTRVIGLGNIYRISLALRMNVETFIERYYELLPECDTNDKNDESTVSSVSSSWFMTCLLKPKSTSSNKRQCQVRPFRVEIPVETDNKARYLVKSICETSIEAKMIVAGASTEPQEGEFIPMDVHVLVRHHGQKSITIINRPIFLGSLNIPLVIN
jgi:hypothetical protein